MSDFEPVNTTPLEMVRQFHEFYDVADRPQPVADIPEAQLRLDLLKEEVKEYGEGLDNGDIVNIAQELADIVYVAYGAALCHGIDLDEVIREVHRANMSKLGEDGNPILRADGKILKGPNYRAPNVAGVLLRQV